MTRLPLSIYPLLILVVSFLTQTTTTLASQAAGTETLVGIVGKDFVLLGADSSVSQSISLTASNLDKIAPLSEPFLPEDERSHRRLQQQQQHQHQQQAIVAAAAGDAADSDRLVGMLQAHATMQEYQAGLGCDVDYVSKKEDDTDAAVLVSTAPGLDVESMAHLARGQIATALRSRSPYKVCLLIAGMKLTTEEQSSSSNAFVAQRVQQQVQNAWVKTDSSSQEDTPATLVETTTTSTTTATTEDQVTPLAPAVGSLQPRLYWLDEYGSLQKIRYGAHGHASNFCLSILDQGYRQDMSLEEATQLLRDCFQQLRTRYLINSPQPPCIKCIDANGVQLIR